MCSAYMLPTLSLCLVFSCSVNMLVWVWEEAPPEAHLWLADSLGSSALELHSIHIQSYCSSVHWGQF